MIVTAAWRSFSKEVRIELHASHAVQLINLQEESKKVHSAPVGKIADTHRCRCTPSKLDPKQAPQYALHLDYVRILAAPGALSTFVPFTAVLREEPGKEAELLPRLLEVAVVEQGDGEVEVEYVVAVFHLDCLFIGRDAAGEVVQPRERDGEVPEVRGLRVGERCEEECNASLSLSGRGLESTSVQTGRQTHM